MPYVRDPVKCFWTFVGRKWLHTFPFYFYCALIDTKDSIKNGETLPIWFGRTENGRRAVCARSRFYSFHSRRRRRRHRGRRLTMPTQNLFHIQLCVAFLAASSELVTKGEADKKNVRTFSVFFLSRSPCAVVIASFDLDIAEYRDRCQLASSEKCNSLFVVVVNSANLTRGSNGATTVAARIYDQSVW